MKTLLSCITLCMIVANSGFAGDEGDEKLVIHLPGRGKAELSASSEKVGRIARAVLVGFWDKNRLEGLSSVRIYPVTTAAAGRKTVGIDSKAFTVKIDSETGCLVSYMDHYLEHLGIPEGRLDEAIANVRAMDLPRLCGWADYGIEFSYELARTRLSSRRGTISFPRVHGGHEFLNESFTVHMRETAAGFELVAIGSNISFMQPAPSSIKVTAEEAKKRFEENILATPYVSRQMADMKEAQDLKVVEGSIRVLGEEPVYLHENEFLQTGEYGPRTGEIRLAYLCTVRLIGKQVTYDIVGYVDAENKTLIGGSDFLRADR